MSLSVTTGIGPMVGGNGWAGANIPAAYSLSQQLLAHQYINNPSGYTGSPSTPSSSTGAYAIPAFPGYASSAVPASGAIYGINVNLFWSGLQKQSIT